MHLDWRGGVGHVVGADGRVGRLSEGENEVSEKAITTHTRNGGGIRMELGHCLVDALVGGFCAGGVRRKDGRMRKRVQNSCGSGHVDGWGRKEEW